MSVSVSIDVSIATVRDLLVGSIEGGSSYWAGFHKDPIFEKSITESDRAAYVKSEGGEYFSCYDIKHPKYCLRISDVEDGTSYNVTLESFTKGLSVMANRYPRHFKDVIAENHDAETSDVFIQCAVFGEIVYG